MYVLIPKQPLYTITVRLKSQYKLKWNFRKQVIPKEVGNGENLTGDKQNNKTLGFNPAY